MDNTTAVPFSAGPFMTPSDTNALARNFDILTQGNPFLSLIKAGMLNEPERTTALLSPSTNWGGLADIGRALMVGPTLLGRTMRAKQRDAQALNSPFGYSGNP